MWVLKKGNLYVSKNTNITKGSYTNRLEYAKMYQSKELAINDSCIDNEKAIKLEDCFLR